MRSTEGIDGKDAVGLYLDAIAKTALLTAIEEVELARTIEAGLFAERVLRGHETVSLAATDEALTQCIRTLRRTLGDEAAAPSFIETVPRHGYRFIAEVEGFGRQTPVPAAPHRTDYGAWRMAGGGVMGACGRNAAEEILRDIG